MTPGIPMKLALTGTVVGFGLNDAPPYSWGSTRFPLSANIPVVEDPPSKKGFLSSNVGILANVLSRPSTPSFFIWASSRSARNVGAAIVQSLQPFPCSI